MVNYKNEKLHIRHKLNGGEAQIGKYKVDGLSAAYTTAQARLKLYSYIKSLKNGVLYSGTYSIIYLSSIDKQQYQVPTDWCLGEMTNELREHGPGSYITEFVSGGPKNYAYRLYTPSTKQYH
uniref:Uncharacterized protein n=1 Tax=Romanomermis culicivorax TaxID=13658 RepID=A0A915HF12_ROMCU